MFVCYGLFGPLFRFIMTSKHIYIFNEWMLGFIYFVCTLRWPFFPLHSLTVVNALVKLWKFGCWTMLQSWIVALCFQCTHTRMPHSEFVEFGEGFCSYIYDKYCLVTFLFVALFSGFRGNCPCLMKRIAEELCKICVISSLNVWYLSL